MRQFTLGTVLSITTGRLLCPIGDVCQILHYMTGDSLFTHQLPRVRKMCEKPLLAQFPQLADVQVPEALSGEESCRLWLDGQESLYGNIFDVEPLESWNHINPLTELAQMTNKPIIPVVIDQ